MLLLFAAILTTTLGACSSSGGGDDDDDEDIIAFFCAMFFGLDGDDSIGIAAGTDGQLARTTDNGTSWMKISTTIDYDIKGMAFESGGTIGVVVGEMGQVGRTMDAGLTWTSSMVGAEDLNSVSAIGTKYWAGGNLGSMYFSGNSGLSWIHQELNTMENINGVCFFDDNLGWAVGDNGFVSGTVDGGDNWTTYSTPVSVNLNGCFTDGLSFSLAYGDKGTLLESLNFGSSFNEIATGTDKDLFAFQFQPSSSPGFFTGKGMLVGDGIGLLTTDFGNNWTAVITEASFNPFGFLKAIAFLQSGFIHIVGEEDVRFESDDEGQIFIEAKIIF